MINLSFYIFNIFLILFNFNHHVYSQVITTDNQPPVQGRVFSGCTLLKNNIYCYGGSYGSASYSGTTYKYQLNENVVLDLNSFNNFTTFDKTNIKWIKKSNIFNGNNNTPLASTGHIKATTLSDDSILFYGGEDLVNLYNPFAHYNPQSDTWKNITLPNNSNYSIRTPIINLGDDKIWIWGGLPEPYNYPLSDMTYVYDYKTNTWPIVQPVSGTILVDHTATLVNNLIYHIGGFYTSVHSSDFEINPFNVFKTYNTIDGTWTNLTVNGANPAHRNFHSTVSTDDKKYLLIYGGAVPVEGEFKLSSDVYYVYDIERNFLQQVNISPHSQITSTTRYGHYATIYNTNHLLLVFGNSDLNTPADSLNVLNIQNPFQPNWVSAPNITTLDVTPEDKGGVDIKIIVPAVVVPVVVVLLGAAVGLFFFIRHRKRKEKKAFILEKEDPRNTMDDQEFGDLTTEGTTVIRSSHSDSQYRNSLIMNQNVNNNATKPFEENPAIKPFEG